MATGRIGKVDAGAGVATGRGAEEHRSFADLGITEPKTFLLYLQRIHHNFPFLRASPTTFSKTNNI
jgi:hypothetical protein